MNNRQFDPLRRNSIAVDEPLSLILHTYSGRILANRTGDGGMLGLKKEKPLDEARKKLDKTMSDCDIDGYQ